MGKKFQFGREKSAFRLVLAGYERFLHEMAIPSCGISSKTSLVANLPVFALKKLWAESFRDSDLRTLVSSLNLHCVMA